MAGIVVNVPYGGLAIPPAVQKRLSLSPGDLRAEHWRLCDPYLLALAKEAAGGDAKRGPWPLVAYPYSPLVADPLGLVAMELGQTEESGPTLLTKDTRGLNLPNWNPSDHQFLMEKTVAPYAADLKARCLEELSGQHLVALVTVRSFAARPQPHERDHRYPRPQITLGSSEDHTPDGLTALAGHIFRTLGFWPQLNWPLSGAVMPKELADQPRLKALGLGLRRDLYLDENTGQPKKDSHGAVVRVVKTFFNLLSQELDRVAKIRLRRAFPPKRSSNVIKAPNRAVEV
ncbi:MAG: N-formylglutamate amidohydrolase [Deltaproteobacteria bacterium]|nr:N-formylglutamate amidohydrolase [Deltaproteobacteria bacterium]